MIEIVIPGWFLFIIQIILLNVLGYGASNGAPWWFEFAGIATIMLVDLLVLVCGEVEK